MAGPTQAVAVTPRRAASAPRLRPAADEQPLPAKRERDRGARRRGTAQAESIVEASALRDILDGIAPDDATTLLKELLEEQHCA